MIDKNSPVPIYLQLAKHMKEQVREKIYRPGDLLPSEKEIAARLGISRMTVRQAFQELQNEGMVYKKKGVGTFLVSHVVEKKAELLSFSQEMRERGWRPGSQVVDFSRGPVQGAVLEKLQMTKGEMVYCLKRLRLADGAPMAVEYCFLPEKLYPDLMNFDMGTVSLYELMVNHYRLRLGYACQQVTAVGLTKDDAGLLGLDGRDFALRGARVLYAEGNLPLEYTESLYHPERYEYSMMLRTL